MSEQATYSRHVLNIQPATAVRHAALRGATGGPEGQEVTVVVRPEDIHLCDAHRITAIGARVRSKPLSILVYMAEALDCQVVLGDNRVRLRLHSSSPTQQGEPIKLAM